MRISYSFFGFATKTLGVQFFSFLLEATIFILAGVHFFILKKHTLFEFSENRKSIKWIMAIACCGIVGVYCMNMGFSLVPVNAVEFLNTIGVAFSIFIGHYYYKERITLQKWVGVGFILLGLAVGEL